MTEASAATPEIPHAYMYIDGEWVDSSSKYEVFSPATERKIATVAKGSCSDADRAVAAARAAFQKGDWRRTSQLERAALLRRVADRLAERHPELTAMVAQENGAPLRTAAAFHVGLPIVHLRYFADLAESYVFERRGPPVGQTQGIGYVRREPIGVCAAIVPWNVPLLLSIWKIAPALAAGNCVVIKPDEHAPLSIIELVREFSAAGLPPGVLNVVTGDGETVGAHLATHPDIRKIAFTGSTAVGRDIMRAAAGNLKKATLELGGKGANIVLDDADIELAVEGTLFAFLAYSGQACESGTRLLLPDNLHDEFVARMITRLRSLKIGNPELPETDMGPVFSASQRDRVLDYIESAKRQGATLSYGGGVPDGEQFSRGFWVEPTVFTDVSNDMLIAREEVFGPVLSVIRYRNLEEAIAIANNSEYGLSAGIWSRDLQKAKGVADALEAGVVWVNDWHVFDPAYPFGGVKQSGVGREVGQNALDEYTEEKSIMLANSGPLSERPYGLLLSTPPVRMETEAAGV